MKNSMLPLSFFCGLWIAFSSSSSIAFEYRYVKSTKSAVEVDISVLGEIEQEQNIFASKPVNTPPAVPLPAVTAIPLDIDTEEVTSPPPVVLSPPKISVPAPEKRLLRPFFTAPSNPVKAAPVTRSLIRPKPKPRINKKPREVKIVMPLTFSELTLEFDASSSEISKTAQRKLDALVTQMNTSPDIRVQIRAFAGDNNNGRSGARRMALSRGLIVRAYLTDRGIKPTRLDIRALGSKTEKTPPDRVDVIFMK